MITTAIIYFIISLHMAGGTLQQVNYDFGAKNLAKSYFFFLFLGPLWLIYTVGKRVYRKYFVTNEKVFNSALRRGHYKGMSQFAINQMEQNCKTESDKLKWKAIKDQYGYKASRAIRRKNA